MFQKEKVVVEEDLFTRLVRWNQERGLIKRGFNHINEVSFIIEELLESTGNYTSESARPTAKKMAEVLVAGSNPSDIDIVGSLADIIVFATGAIAKQGFDPSLVMEEVFKEINSRTGETIDGKFVKDLNVVPYVPDLESCRK